MLLRCLQWQERSALQCALSKKERNNSYASVVKIHGNANNSDCKDDEYVVIGARVPSAQKHSSGKKLF